MESGRQARIEDGKEESGRTLTCSVSTLFSPYSAMMASEIRTGLCSRVRRRYMEKLRAESNG